MTELQLDALDTLFFRDGKPFSLGEESWADGLFPPSPSVLYGAIRSTYALLQGIPFEQIESETAALNICSMYLRFEGQRNGNYLPLPREYGEYKQKSEGQRHSEQVGEYTDLVKLIPQKDLITQFQTGTAASSLQTGPGWLLGAPHAGRPIDTPADAWMGEEDFSDYLFGEAQDTLKGKRLQPLVPEEPKIGIARDRYTRSSAEGRLYRVGMRRVSRLHIRVRFQGLDFSSISSGMMKLGGEGKTVHFRNLSHFPDLKPWQWEFPEKAVSRFKVYLSTPAMLEHSIPDLQRHLGIAARFLGACSGKAVHIGGFDMKRRRPKPMRLAAPAGSVYLFESDTPVQLAPLQGLSLSDFLPEQGFGISYFAHM
ncbi:MAG: type III-B CRISPR module-associated Cmr3 family protein [Bacteroidota bacterium]